MAKKTEYKLVVRESAYAGQGWYVTGPSPRYDGTWLGEGQCRHFATKREAQAYAKASNEGREA